jgi:hypothetical protein
MYADGSSVPGARRVDERRVAVVAPRDDGAVDPVLVLATDVQEPGAFRRAHPFVAVARIEVRTEAVEVERRLRRAVGAVDDDRQPRRVCERDDVADRKHEPGRRGDVADKDDSGARGARGEQRVDDVLRPRDRQRHLRADVTRAGAGAEPLPREVAGAVLERRGQHLVTGLEPERARGDVDAGGGVRDEREIVRGRSEIRSEPRPHAVDQLR